MMQFLHLIQSLKNVQSTHKNLKADNSKKISGSIGPLVFYRLYQGIVCRPLRRVLFIGTATLLYCVHSLMHCYSYFYIQ